MISNSNASIVHAHILNDLRFMTPQLSRLFYCFFSISQCKGHTSDVKLCRNPAERERKSYVVQYMSLLRTTACWCLNETFYNRQLSVSITITFLQGCYGNSPPEGAGEREGERGGKNLHHPSSPECKQTTSLVFPSLSPGAPHGWEILLAKASVF